MTFMLSTEIAPPPGARAVSGLRTQARAARRIALIALSGSIALLSSVQMLAERAPTRQETLPLAVLALALFLVALPALAFTQVVWGARMRMVREREHELYAARSAPLARVASRLAVAAAWAVTLLLGLTGPRLFRQSGLYGFADTISQAMEVLALTGYVAGVFFAIWWARDALGTLARAGRPGVPPDDPWDPGHGTPRRGGAALWSGAAIAVTALVCARAHLWEPGTLLLFALLATALVCPLVTGE